MWLTKDASPEIRDVYVSIGKAETEEEVEELWEQLDATLAAESALREKQERERRRETGMVKYVAPKAAEKAGAFFEDLKANALAAKGEADDDDADDPGPLPSP